MTARNPGGTELGRLRHIGLMGATQAGQGRAKLFEEPGRYKNLHDSVYATQKGKDWLKLVPISGHLILTRRQVGEMKADRSPRAREDPPSSPCRHL